MFPLPTTGLALGAVRTSHPIAGTSLGDTLLSTDHAVDHLGRRVLEGHNPRP